MGPRANRCAAVWRGQEKKVGRWPCAKRAGHKDEHESAPLGSGFRWQNRMKP